jgi:squalene-hopene/tetraprenyl-beta-curcumene cyclase
VNPPGLFSIGALIAGIGLAGTNQALADDLSWNPQAAGRYLESRQQAWMEFTAKRSHQPQNMACTSCHTVLPDLLAGPALARTLGETVPSPFSVVMTDRVRDKVMRPDAPQNRRIGYLRSAEPIIYALVLASDDRGQHRVQLSRETEEGLRRMWAEQIRTGDNRGSWTWADAALDPWETPEAVYYGTALAALAVGFAPPEYAKRPELQEQIEAMSEYLRSRFHEQIVHHRLAALWASSKLPNIVSAADRESTLAQLWRTQNEDGGWSWSALGPWKPRPEAYVAAVATGKDSDGYATAFAACSLRESGLATSAPQLHRALTWLASHQDAKTGGWEARSLNGENPNDPVLGHLMEDAATAYAALALSKADS